MSIHKDIPAERMAVTKTKKMQYIQKYCSPLGSMLMAAEENQLIGLWFDKAKYFGSTLSDDYEYKEIPVLRQTAEWLDCYFSGNIPEFTPPLRLNGSPFQLEVWEILRSIPYGETVTYREIAQKLAKQRGQAKMSAQAVGGAVGRNPVSLIIPCHRVIGSSGSLTGYAGGIERKSKLLKFEKDIASANET